jgi:hypothetical protein
MLLVGVDKLLTGFDAPPCTYAQARVLAEKLGRSDYLVPVAFGQWPFHLVRSDMAQALSNAERIEEIGRAPGDGALTFLGHYIYSKTCFYRGELVDARALFECERLLDGLRRARCGGPEDSNPCTPCLDADLAGLHD